MARYVSSVGGLFSGFGLTAATMAPGSVAFRSNANRLHSPMTAWRPRTDHAIKAALPIGAAKALIATDSITDWRTCGQPGSPPCNQGRAGPQAALGGFGAVFGCGSFQVALGRLRAVLDQYDSAGLDKSNGDFTAAKAFADNYGTFSLSVIWSNDDCTTVTSEAQSHINNVASLLGISAPNANVTTGAGGVNLPQAPQDQPLLDKLKPFAIALAIIAGAIVIAPGAWALFRRFAR